MTEIFSFDLSKYPTMAKIAPNGEFGGGISIVIDAANKLVEPEEIAEFSRELTEWLSVLRAQGDESTVVGGWISYVVGHFDSSVEKRWQNAIPQADMSTGFMPEKNTLRIKYRNADDLKESLSAAITQNDLHIKRPLFKAKV